MHPLLLDIGFLQIRYYGLMYALSVYFGLLILRKDFQRAQWNKNEDQIFNLVFWVFLGGLLGGRIYYVLFSLDYYLAPTTPLWEMFAIWHGGLAIHGGIIGGLLALMYICKHYELPLWRVCDYCCSVLMLGQTLGRFGNFMNGDAHGIPTDQPWGIVFPYGPASREFPGQPLHPVMLYELVLNFFAFLLLRYLLRLHRKKGLVSCAYLILYSIIRFCVTFFRADDLYFYGLRAPHIISVIGFIIGLSCILIFKLYQRDLKWNEEMQYLPLRKKNSKK